MTNTKNDQENPNESINLEALSLDELDRTPICESDSVEEPRNLPSQLQGPHSGRRCQSSERELYKNQFPPDD